MRFPLAHIVLAILLALAHIGGEVVPCTDATCGECADEQVCCTSHVDMKEQHNSSSQEEHQRSSHHSDADQHPTDVCSCSCHMPGIEVAAYISVVVESATVSYHSPDYNLPSYIPSSPDHVPLV